MSRYYLMLGYETILSTGTDEHGNKVENAAKAAKLPVKDYCQDVSSQFRKMSDQFDIGYTYFVRTTDEKHRQTVQEFWKKLWDRNHIYLGKYSGWYCVPDEAFVPEIELIETTDSATGRSVKISKDSGHPVEWTEEDNYKFRLSNFGGDLKHWLKDANSVRPAKYHKILSEWIDEGTCLEDLSVSRPVNRAPWGIAVPNDESHTIYVWLDALVNYLTSAGYSNDRFSTEYWPPSMQIIGKDILKFHGVYWPAFLIAAGLEPPRSLLCHSHWMVNGEKMSKSKGNVVSPFKVAEEFTNDGLRYFLLREAVPHNDANYSKEKIRRVLNSELADTFGNLVSRCMAKSINPRGEIPDVDCQHVDRLNSEDSKLVVKLLEKLSDESKKSYDELNLHHVVDGVMQALHAANKMIEHHKPWKLQKESEAGNEESRLQLDAVLSLAMETSRISALVLLPIVPKLSSKLLDYLKVPVDERTWEDTKFLSPLIQRRRQQRRVEDCTSPILFRRIHSNKK